MLEILLTRITSVTAWYHLSFFVISLAMLGMTVGAMAVAMKQKLFEETTPEQLMANGCRNFALSTPVVVAISFHLPLVEQNFVTPFSSMLFFGILLAVPFFFSGFTLSIALTRAGLHPSFAYAADLVGASIGCALVIPLFWVLDAPSGILFASALGLLAWGLFSWTKSGERTVAFALCVTLTCLSVTNARMIPPPFRPLWVKGNSEEEPHFLFCGWNSFSRITVDPTVQESPSCWSVSFLAPPEATAPISQRRIRIDGEAATWMAQDSGLLEKHSWSDWDLCSLGNRFRPDGSALIIGFGGGRDIIAALRAGNRPVVGLELNPLIVNLHTDRMRDFSHLADLPQVELVSGEARSFLTCDRRRHKVILMSLIDTWASQGAGAFSLAENGLYTAEAWDLFLSRLEPDGVFSVSRWYFPPSPHETARMIGLACETLYRRGIQRPRDHIAVLGHKMVATLLVSPAPFTEKDISRLDGEAKRLGALVLALPGRDSPNPLLQAILSSSDRGALWNLTSTHELDLSPPTDDRPFFFNVLRPSGWFRNRNSLNQMDYHFLANHEATQTLLYSLAVSLILTVVLIGIPLLRLKSDLGTWPTTALGMSSLFFALIGAGFMFIEIGLLSRLNVFLGNPTLSLVILLGGLICSAGIGSFLSARFKVPDGKWSRLFPLIPALLSALAGGASGPIQTHFSGAPLETRVAIALILVVLPALGMGICFPMGLRLVSSLRERLEKAIDLGPWLWGINGACGVCASSLALACSMVWGISATLAIGSAAYLLLLPCTFYLGGKTETGILENGSPKGT